MRSMCIIMLLSTLCACAAEAAPRPSVAMFRGGPGHAGQYDTSGAAALDAVRFVFVTDGPIRGAAVASEGVLYFGSEDGSIYAVDAKTGHEHWRFHTQGAVTATPAVADGRLFIPSRDGHLYALDAISGRVLWDLPFAQDLGAQNYWDFYQSSPALLAGVVYAGSGDGRLYAVDAATGHVRWTYEANARIRSSPALDGGLVVVGTVAGEVIALNQSTGRLRWRFATEGASHHFKDKDNDTTSVMDSPTIAGGIVAFGGRDGYLYALDLATGKQRWRTTHDGSSWILSSATDGDTLYVGSGSALIVQAADLRTGRERWRFRVKGAVFGSVTRAGDGLVVSDMSGRISGLRATDGALRWSFPMGARSFATPTVYDNTVYCGADNGVLYALSTAAARPITLAPRRIVYWQGDKDRKIFSWFKSGVDAALREQLKAAGYEQLDATQLHAFLQQQIAMPSPSVLVFADNKIPLDIADDASGPALLRRYLGAGGKVVLTGPNPLAYLPDPETGEITEVNYDVPKRVFGAPYEQPNDVAGYYASVPTPEGRSQGLRNAFVSFMAIQPNADSTVTALARDEFGKDTAWVKTYGGRRGTGLLQLSLPRETPADLTEYQAVLDYGITW